MMQPMVRLDGVTAAPERGAPPVLRDLSLALEAGTTTAVTGPNGAGKSTLCRVVAGLVAPARGTVEVAGRPVVPGHPAHGVAMLFQSPRRSVSPRMTLRQAIAEPLELRRRPAARTRRTVDAMADAVGLTPDLLRRRPAAVSDGRACCASSRADSSPMPAVPPVTSAVWPARSFTGSPASPPAGSGPA